MYNMSDYNTLVTLVAVWAVTVSQSIADLNKKIDTLSDKFAMMEQYMELLENNQAIVEKNKVDKKCED